MNDDFKLKKIEVGTPHLKTVTEDGDSRIRPDTDANKKEKSDITWKKVKNGKKIKLTKVDVDTSGNGTYTHKDDGFKIAKEVKGTVASTPIRITYYDKKDKTTKVTEIYITRLINK